MWCRILKPRASQNVTQDIALGLQWTTKTTTTWLAPFKKIHGASEGEKQKLLKLKEMVRHRMPARRSHSLPLLSFHRHNVLCTRRTYQSALAHTMQQHTFYWVRTMCTMCGWKDMRHRLNSKLATKVLRRLASAFVAIVIVCLLCCALCAHNTDNGSAMCSSNGRTADIFALCSSTRLISSHSIVHDHTNGQLPYLRYSDNIVKIDRAAAAAAVRQRGKQLRNIKRNRLMITSRRKRRSEKRENFNFYSFVLQRKETRAHRMRSIWFAPHTLAAINSDHFVQSLQMHEHRLLQRPLLFVEKL